MSGQLIKGVVLLGVAGLPFVASPAAGQVTLITVDEARRPHTKSADLTFRAGISRGPAIELLSPKPSETAVQSPVHLQLKFEGHGGAQIDEASFRLIDVSDPPVDLTDRIREFINQSGIDVPAATLPDGSYTIRAEIKDKDGRAGFLTFTLRVAKQH
jgi:hypothetical protein